MDSTAAVPETTDDRVAVELHGVPLLLHSAWQMQAESLLREYLLARLDDDNGTDEIERHAAASDAMALLQEQVPAPVLDEDPEALDALRPSTLRLLQRSSVRAVRRRSPASGSCTRSSRPRPTWPTPAHAS